MDSQNPRSLHTCPHGSGDLATSPHWCHWCLHKTPGASCCLDADVWRDQGATLSGAENDIARVPLRVRKARNIKERAPNSPNTAAGCQENPLPPVQAALRVGSSET